MSVVEVRIVDRVAEVVLDRPPLNVVDLATAGELCDAFEKLDRGAGLAAVVLRARGRAFSAGVDVRDHLPDRGEEMIRRFDHACMLLVELECPAIAVVHGAALGGGWELAMACDLVIAAGGATFGLPEIRLGVFPPLAAVTLPRLVGAHRAAELVLMGRILQAVEAAHMGLVTSIVPAQRLDAIVEATLAALRALSPEALRVAKRAMRLSGVHPTREEIAAAEAIYMETRLHAPDAIEGLTAFMEKRAPRWSGAKE